MDCLRCRTSNVIASRRRSNPFSIVKRLIPNSYFLISFVLFFTACSDFFEPVDSTPEPTEYSYNYWLLRRTYLFEDELPLLDENGDSVSELYDKLSDPFTRYVLPSKSEATITHINTSVVPGDVGLEYFQITGAEHPLVIYRVYADGPAGRAGVPRHGNILNVNGVEITNYEVYDSVLTYSKDISMQIAYMGDTALYEMVKEDVYAPTVFVDTSKNIPVITITGFKLMTADKVNGTLGELKAYLDSTQNVTEPRIIDLRNNPGGHVSHCVAMADLFIKNGVISTRAWRFFSGDGEPTYNRFSEMATPGHSGENGKFVMLVNKNSASCAEIFVAALHEGAGIPVAGQTTYGKGIGQSTWNTMNGGLAIITNLEFLTPQGNSYHKKGIVPDYPCDDVSLQCGVEAVYKYFGKSTLEKARDTLFAEEHAVLRRTNDIGGAFMKGDDN